MEPAFCICRLLLYMYRKKMIKADSYITDSRQSADRLVLYTTPLRKINFVPDIKE